MDYGEPREGLYRHFAYGRPCDACEYAQLTCVGTDNWTIAYFKDGACIDNSRHSYIDVFSKWRDGEFRPTYIPAVALPVGV